MSAPYAEAAVTYLRRGWGPIRLHPGSKGPPPVGWTGYGAAYPSGADVHDWATNGAGSGNVALRMPETVLGIDVDAYDGKPGAATLAAAVERLGPLPMSPISTSRTDGISGIRFYRVPPGRCWADVLGPGVEVIHHGHRYAVVAPSVHPEGRVYRWVDEQQQVPGPAVDELPDLPPGWVADLDRGSVAARVVKGDVTGPEAVAFLAGMPPGEPCRYVTRVLDEARTELGAAASRHDALNRHVGRLVRAGEQGHRGVAVALDGLEDAFRGAVGADPSRPVDRGEWARSVAGAVAFVKASPTPDADRGCCGRQLSSADPYEEHDPEGDPGGDLVAQDDLPSQDDTEAADAAWLFARDVDRQAYDLRVRAAARRKVAAEQAGEAPPFDAGLLGDVLARPPEPPHRVEGLIPTQASTVVVAARKTGKTTLTLNLARTLITGGAFLGRFAVRPITGRVGFLNYEVSAAQLARWADDVGVPRDRLYLVNVRGRRNPLGNDDDRERLAERLREQQVESLFVDPFGRAFTGQSQNDAGEVGAWLADLDRWARADVGAVDVVLSVHAGWNGERTRGSSAVEDWADVMVNLVRDPDDDQVRYLKAEGRLDAVVEEDRLDFDPSTRTLRMAGAGSRKQVAAGRQVVELVPEVVAYVSEFPDCSQAAIEQNVSGRATAVRAAVAEGVSRGLIERRKRGKKWTHSLLVPPRPTSSGTSLETSSPRPIGDEDEVADEDAATRTRDGTRSTDCTRCGSPLHRVQLDAGETTHPSCDSTPTTRADDDPEGDTS